MDAIYASYSTGLTGLKRAVHELRREASSVAHSVVDGSTADLAGALVRGLAAQRAAEANAASVRRADQVRGSTIDILA